jgi:Membrane-associating domain.
MFALHTALYALLGTSLVFAIIELGLSAYVTSEAEGTYNVGDGLGYKTVKVHPPAIYDFLLFSSVWTILITGAAFFLPRFFARKARSLSTDKAISGALIAMYFVTSVFWLAGFADIANELDGYTGFDYLNAIIAFGVLLW